MHVIKNKDTECEDTDIFIVQIILVKLAPVVEFLKKYCAIGSA
jgi:hypothetical protein